MWKSKKKVILFLLWLITAHFFECFAMDGEDNPNKIYVGWATKNITPDKPVALDGQFQTRISVEHMDSVTCTALAIETRNESKSVETAIMVSCDIVAIREGLLEEVKKVLKPKLPDFDLNKLWLNATHTHTGPVLSLEVINYLYDIPEDAMKPSEYMLFAAERIAQAALEAWNNRQPAGMSWGLGQAVVGYNRRAVYFEPVPSGFGKGTAVMYGKTNREDFSNIEGYEDHGLEMMFFWDKDKKLTGMVLNIACPAQDTEGLSQLSADFWNEARAELHKRYGADVYIFAQTSAAGDISPHLLWRQEAEMEMLRRKGISHRQEIGIRIANAVDDVYPYVQKYIKTEVVFNHFSGTIDLPVRKVTKEEVKEAEILIKNNPAQARFHNKIIIRYNQQDRDTIYSAPVHIIRLGDVAIATNPFELFLDFGIRIKSRSKAIITFLVQHSGRGHYVPTAKAEAGGGYSAIVQSNPVGSEGGQILVDRTVEIINEMFTTAK